MDTHPNHRILFEPVKIGPVTAKNRLYQVPHGPGAGNLLDVDIGIKQARAEGGWGVVCCEICSIHPSSDLNYVGIRRLWNDQHIKENARTVEAIHEYDALAGIELGHYGLAAFNFASREPMLGPSRQFGSIAGAGLPLQAQAMEKEDIRKLLNWQKDAAVRAKHAGFDIIYVYAAHNLALPMQFLSSRHNHRNDEYGGSLENRVRLLREMIEVTKDAVGDECAVAVRLSVDELLGPEGITAKHEGREVIELLAELPDLWDINVSDWSNDSPSSRFCEEGWQEEYVSFVKSVTTKPVVGVGHFTSPDAMASQVKRGVLDFVGAARASIADPFLPIKIKEGRSEDIRECIGCNFCIKTANHFVVSGCTQNPTMGEEWRRGWHPENIEEKVSDTTILVVGAGPAGLEATRALAQRGYEVALAEATDQLGGRVRHESVLPGLAEWLRVADWRISQIITMPNVQIYKSNKLTAKDVINLDFQHIAIATGSTWRRDCIGPTNLSPVKIDDGAKIYTFDDLAAGNFPTNGPVIIFDDDQYYLGGVIAETLRKRGLEVRLVTPGHTISQHTGSSLEAGKILRRMLELNVGISVQRNLREVRIGEVITDHLITGVTEVYDASAVVLVTGRDPVDNLYWDLVADQDKLLTSNIKSVSRLGDCYLPDTIAASVFSGHKYAREFDADPIDISQLPASVRTMY